MTVDGATPDGIKAHVSDQWMRHGTRVHVYRPRSNGDTEVLRSDGTWRVLSTAESLDVTLDDELGFFMPEDSALAVYAALERHYGNALHSTTEAKVLREALKLEQDRVDRVLDVAMARQYGH